jgi:hypothetical protein
MRASARAPGKVATVKEASRARRRRQAWARRFRPAVIDLFIVAEAPPAALDRYFSFPDVFAHDSLFRQVVRTILKVEPGRADKRTHLEALRDRAVVLIDLSLDPVDGEDDLGAFVPGLIRRARRLRPRRIVLVKTGVYDAAFPAMQRAGLPVIDERVPFPGSGQQTRFRESFTRARRRAPVGGWRRGEDATG